MHPVIRIALLACRPYQLRAFAGSEIASPRIDIDTAPAGITGIYGKILRFARFQYVQKNPFDALFMEFIGRSQADDVFEQSLLIDLRADRMYLETGPVRLSGNGAVCLQKVGYQRFLDGRFFTVAS